VRRLFDRDSVKWFIRLLPIAFLIPTIQLNFVLKILVVWGVIIGLQTILNVAWPAPVQLAQFRQPHKGNHSVVLLAVGDNRIAVTKAVRQITGLERRAAIELIRFPPAPILSGVGNSAAKAGAKLLRKAGGSAEIS
jgi:ribosomal protein L7/L12